MGRGAGDVVYDEENLVISAKTAQQGCIASASSDNNLHKSSLTVLAHQCGCIATILAGDHLDTVEHRFVRAGRRLPQ